MEKYIILLVAVLLSIAIKVNVVQSFSGGAPAAACATLSPDPNQHGAPPQAPPVPYEVDISALDNGNGGFTYVPGRTYMCKYMQLAS